MNTDENAFIETKYQEYRGNKMKKPHTPVHYSNPLGMLAQGVEQIVREKTEHPIVYNDYESKEIARKEASGVTTTPTPSAKGGFHVIELLHHLLWGKKDHQV